MEPARLALVLNAHYAIERSSQKKKRNNDFGEHSESLAVYDQRTDKMLVKRPKTNDKMAAKNGTHSAQRNDAPLSTLIYD